MEEQDFNEFFVIATVSDGGTIAGTVTKDHLAKWASNCSKLLLDCPRRLITIPVQGKTAMDRNKVTGYQFMFSPLFPHKTPQDKLFVDPTTVETVGGVSRDENGWVKCYGSSDIQLFFDGYMELVAAWKNEISGIITPTVQEVANVDATKDLPKMRPVTNITDFMKK